MTEFERVPFERDAYEARVRGDSAAGTCFICAIASGERDGHLVVYRDDICIVFLARFPTLVGYTLVAPIEHRTDITRPARNLTAGCAG